MARPLKCECNLPTCKTCTDRNKWRAKHSKEARAAAVAATTAQYPCRHEVVIWECSDGREFSSELEAAYHQLNIYRSVATERRAA